MSKNKISRIFDKRMMAYMVFCLCPLIAGLILGLISDTSIFSLDAWNTVWNDERGYYRAVQTIRTQGLPTGVQGYNEAEAVWPAWGAYNAFTYVPFVLVSLFTGATSHNFIYYCNVIISILANVIFVSWIKPTKEKTVWLILFSLTFLLYQRYVWSGMSEACSVFMMIASLTCAIKLFDEETEEKHRVFLLVSLLLLSWFFGIIRPFLFAVILIPITYIGISNYGREKKIIFIFSIIAGTALAFLLYLELRKGCAPYFTSGTMDTLEGYLLLLKNGEILTLIKSVLMANYSAAVTIYDKLFNTIGLVSITFFVSTVLLGYMLATEKNKHRKVLLCACIWIDILIFEATIVLYSPAQLHRMLLGPAVMNCYFLCVSENGIVKKIQQIVVVTVLICAIICRPDFFRLPQEKNVIDEVAVKAEFKEIMPYDEESKWGNTIAHAPENENLYLHFCFPVYMSTSGCTLEYLENAISNNTLKSKYLYIAEHSELNALCSEKYEMLWNQYGYCIYRNKFE